MKPGQTAQQRKDGLVEESFSRISRAQPVCDRRPERKTQNSESEQSNEADDEFNDAKRITALVHKITPL
ncbi:MAG: hypothetical protein M0C28_34930 [Candidatus Moduliflexus flocculans]|nr:hypothetical protein [Candidatus Moduliflexus flocculans]